MTRDQDYMAMALDLARLGLGHTSPNPAVGAVIVKNQTILGMGFHHRAGEPHAEIEAINDALLKNYDDRDDFLKGSTLYVTLEPCCHEGRTPACTEALIRYGFKDVVVGMRDPDKKVAGRGLKLLLANNITVCEGVLKKECEDLNEHYIKHRTTGLPFMILKVATTLDGKIGYAGLKKDKSKKNTWISGEESRDLVHQIRDRVDAILVGVGTVIADDPRLTTRVKGRIGKDPIRVIVDSRLTINPKAGVLNNSKSKAPTIIATTVTQIPKSLSKNKHVEILVCKKTKKGQVDLKDLMKKLGSRGVLSVLVEGGATILNSFVEQKLGDRMMQFISTSYLGQKGIDLFPQMVISELSKRLWIRKPEIRLIGNDILVEGRLR